MRSTIRYVGLDVHKETIVVGVAEEGRSTPEVFATIPNTKVALDKALERLCAKAHLRCCYEAGPTGYGIYRDLKSAGITCVVVAPALVPEQKGNRVKTDRRDAAKLARFLRSGDLTPVYVPAEVSEATRDLVRARFDAKKAERVARQQLGHFLLRHDFRYPGRTAWTRTHLDWIRCRKLEHEAQKRVLVDYLHAVEETGDRIRRLGDDISELVKVWSLYPLTQALGALRGIRLVAAATIAAELGDIRRFERPEQLMA